MPQGELCEQLPGDACAPQVGLRKILAARYISGVASSVDVNVTFLRFRDSDAAFAYFTGRVRSMRSSPNLRQAPLTVDGQAVVNGPLGVFWRGQLVGRLLYTNSELTPQQLTEIGGKTADAMLRELAGRVLGDSALPAAAARLPSSERVEFGVLFRPQSALGVLGSGKGALGFYQRGQRPYRIFVSAAPDESAARDLERLLRRQTGYRKLKNMPFGAFELDVKSDRDGPPACWLIGRWGSRLVAVGDDADALLPSLTEAEKEKRTLTRSEKLQLLRGLLYGT